MGDLTLEKLMNEFLLMGFRMEFQHVGGGTYTEVTLRKGELQQDNVKSIPIILAVPSNNLRDSDKLKEIREKLKKKVLTLVK